MQRRIAFHIEEFGPGDSIQNPKPGDFVLTRGHEWTSFMLRVGERLRYRRFAYWNHAEPWHMMPADLAQAYQVEPPK